MAQRTAVRAIQTKFQLSERRACALVGLGRSTCRYRPRRQEWPALRDRLRVLAGERRRFGYRRLPVLLRREGFTVNLKRVYRLYPQEGLTVRRRRRRRRVPRGVPRLIGYSSERDVSTRSTNPGCTPRYRNKTGWARWFAHSRCSRQLRYRASERS